MAATQAGTTSPDLTYQFWHSIEISLGCVVPKYVQHILRLRGYDNAASVGTLASDDIQKIQDYFKAKLEKYAAIDKTKFFHEFHNDGDEFEILPGHVKLIEKIVSHINALTELHGPEFFSPHFEENIRNIRKPVRVATIRGRHTKGPKTISQTLARSSFVGLRNSISQSCVEPVTTTISGSHVHKKFASTSARLEACLEDLTEKNAEEPVDQQIVVNGNTILRTSTEHSSNLMHHVEPESHANENEPADIEPSDVEKFIVEERAHLIEIIKVWMNKNVPEFFEQYFDQLKPEILEALMEKSKDTNDDTDTDDSMVFVFKFNCPKCGKSIRATQQPSKNGDTSYFSLSNIERHWKVHAQENQPKKPKKSRDKKNISIKSEKRKLRSKTTECDVKKEFSGDDAEFEVLTDEESENEGPGDFKIVKRKTPFQRKI